MFFFSSHLSTPSDSNLGKFLHSTEFFSCLGWCPLLYLQERSQEPSVSIVRSQKQLWLGVHRRWVHPKGHNGQQGSESMICLCLQPNTTLLHLFAASNYALEIWPSSSNSSTSADSDYGS